MPRKGKKKKQNTQDDAASTSETASSKQSQEVSQQQKSQKQTSPQQQQQLASQPSLGKPQQVSQGSVQQQQISQGRSQQQQRTLQQQVSQGTPQQQQQVAQGPPQQQQLQGAWALRQQQVSQSASQPQPLQQQAIPGPSRQQQEAWQRQQQQVSQDMQQRAWGPQQQQVPKGIPQQQQQQRAWGPQQQRIQIGVPQQQQQQRAWGPEQQQISPNLPQQQQQRAEIPQQQQVPYGMPQQQSQIPYSQQQVSQQQQQRAWTPQQQQQPTLQGIPQQVAWSQPQQQQIPPGLPQQRAWIPQQQRQEIPPNLSQQRASIPQQQALGGALQQQQKIPSGQQQQQVPLGLPQQQQQRGWGLQHQQQQKVPTDIGGAGDYQVQTVKQDTGRGTASGDVQQQQKTTSVQLPELSQLTLKDTFQATKSSEKTKMKPSVMKQYQLCIPKRRDPTRAGTLGTGIRVWTNMFQIIFNKNFVTNAVHYDVTITPTASKAIHRKVFEQCRKIHFSERYPAFDGKKNAYSANDLPFNDSMCIELEILDSGDRKRPFCIKLEKVANIDLSWIKNVQPGLDEASRDQTGIQVLDIIMRHAPESQFTTVGRSLFWKFDDNPPLGSGLSLSRGGFSSTVLGWKPYLNVDVAHKGFHTSQNVISLMAELTREKVPSAAALRDTWNQARIEKFLKGLRINYQIGNLNQSKRTYRVNGLGPTALEHQFDCNGSRITIVEYFKQCKNYTLRHPDMPCIWVGATNKEEKIYLPAELCTIVEGQPFNRKLDDYQTRNMIREAATNAPTRKRRIQEAFTKIQVNNSPVLTKEFHLSVDVQMKDVAARVLPPPELRYAAGAVTVNKGVWQAREFQQAISLEDNSWTILDLSRVPKLDDLINKLMSLLQNNAPRCGMRIGKAQTPFKTIRSARRTEIIDYFSSKKGLKLIIVIIPDRGEDTYSTVKQITEVDVGVLTQCVKCPTLNKLNVATITNILLKINSKLNGINHTFNRMPTCLQDNSCMLVGADVTHPPPDVGDMPSIAAVAASSDASVFQYNIALRLQQPKQEMILDLQDIITSQLSIYKARNKRLPTRIIYYRDGVSEGQLAQVMYFEIEAIKRACKQHAQANIQITCLVVQKRHHIRLFPMHNDESDDRNRNVRAGTIVDTEITHPNHIDFYLVSHASIQGTARPTKYRCIYNESNYTEDQIEELTYYLCHIYARCTRAVSYPAPTYYAHLAAYRGRALINGMKISLEDLKAAQSRLTMKMPQSPMCFI